MRLDKELETAVGYKDRCIGVLREHEKEHGCQSWQGLTYVLEKTDAASKTPLYTLNASSQRMALKLQRQK